MKIYDISEHSLGNEYWVIGEAQGKFIFSDDGKLVAMGGYLDDYSHQVITITNSDDLSVIRSWHLTESQYIISMAFTPNNKELLVYVHDLGDEVNHEYEKIYRMNLNNGVTEKIELFPSGLSDCSKIIYCSPDGKSSVIIDDEGSIHIYHPDRSPTIIPDGWSSLVSQITYKAREYSSDIAFTWSPNSELLAITTEGDSIIIIDVDHGRLLHSLIGHTDVITDLEFSPDGSLLASTSFDGTVRLWGIP